MILDKEIFELSTFRYKKEEGEPSLKEDLGLRDFTINAMAYHLTDGLKDPFNGRYDLRKRVINAVGDADKRFQEDPLRIIRATYALYIRAIRLAGELDFSIHPATIEAIHSMRKELENISPERMKDELTKYFFRTNHPFQCKC